VTGWLLAQETQVYYSDGPAKIVIAIIIIMALWGQKTNRGDK